MASIPTILFSALRSTLLRCREFESYRALRAVFVTPDLSPFRIGLREADNPAGLVDLFLDYILTQNHITKGPALPLFLAALRDHYDPDNALCGELDQLHRDVSAVMRPAQHREQDPHHKHHLFDLLLRLDFRPQVQMVRQVIDEQPVAAFLIHGPPDYGQRVLVHRLSHLQLRWESGRYITLDAGANGTGKSPRSLWREIAKRVELSPDTDPLTLAQKVCQWWQTQDVIFVIHTVDYIPAFILGAWLDEFWRPLVETARRCAGPAQPQTHLLLFLVDYSDCVCQSGLHFVEQPDELRHTHLPLRLPSTGLFPEEELDIWQDTASEVLPTRIIIRALLEATQNGIPDLVYEHICAHCGISWEGELAP